MSDIGFKFRRKQLFYIFLFLMVYETISNQTIRTGSNQFITYYIGNLNLIITAPHGGYIKSNKLPTRHNGCMVNGKCFYDDDSCHKTEKCRVITMGDRYTRSIAVELSNDIASKLGNTLRPHCIINNLHRSKLDPNREYYQATQSDPIATDAYYNYMGFINEARKLIYDKEIDKEGGLHIDIHGHSHTNQRIELGYRLSKTQLNKFRMSNNEFSNSSIRNLLERKCKYGCVGECYEDYLRGNMSFGKLLSDQNLRSVPSEKDIRPLADKYFKGGYTTNTFGSSKRGRIDAIQMEINSEYRTPSMRRELIDKLSNAIIIYMKNNYGLNIPSPQKYIFVDK